MFAYIVLHLLETSGNLVISDHAQIAQNVNDPLLPLAKIF